MQEIKVIDTTLRDAHQCLLATRMTTAMMLPVAEKMDRSGFETIDLMSAIQSDKPIVRLLKELATRRNLGHVSISKGDMRLELGPAR